jgi:hypothetical protein
MIFSVLSIWCPTSLPNHIGVDSTLRALWLITPCEEVFFEPFEQSLQLCDLLSLHVANIWRHTGYCYRLDHFVMVQICIFNFTSNSVFKLLLRQDIGRYLPCAKPQEHRLHPLLKHLLPLLLLHVWQQISDCFLLGHQLASSWHELTLALIFKEIYFRLCARLPLALLPTVSSTDRANEAALAAKRHLPNFLTLHDRISAEGLKTVQL